MKGENELSYKNCIDKMLIFIVAFYSSILLFILNYKPFGLFCKGILSIFYSIWAFAMICSCFSPYGFAPVSDETYVCMLTGNLSFLIGFLCLKKDIKQDSVFESKKDFGMVIDRLASNPIYICVLTVCIIYLLYLFRLYFAQIAIAQSLGDVRTDIFSSDLYGPIYKYVNMMVLSPLAIVSIPVFAYKMTYDRKSITAFLIIIYELVYINLSGGRFGYISILLGILFVLISLHLSRKQIKRYRKYFAIVLVFVSFAIIMITGARKGNMELSKEQFEDNVEMTTEQVVSYFVGPIPAFDYAVKNEYVNRIGGYQYGALTGSSVVLFARLIFNRVGIEIDPPLNRLTEIKQDEYIPGSDTMMWNALYTSNLFFFLDFGFWGILFIPFFLGIFARVVFSLYLLRKNIYSMILAYYTAYLMIYSVFDWNFTDPFILLLVILLLISGKRTGKTLCYNI